MAARLGHGVLGFSRDRIGLQPTRGGGSSNGVLTYASIHHGGPVGPPRMTFSAARATVREWQGYHMGKGWIDLGYHFLVDGLGRVYQGRPITLAPAAVEGHNAGSVAICFMQDGRSHRLNPAQRRTLKVMFEYGLPRWGMPPLSRFSTDPREHHGVYGHKEFTWGTSHASNECPGGLILEHLRWRRSRYPVRR